jgi:hypothetical protein
MRRRLAWFCLLGLLLGCGGATSSDPTGSAVPEGGLGGGGSGSGGTLPARGGAGPGGSAGSGTAGAWPGGAAGAAGAAGSWSGSCSGLPYCECIARPGCTPVTEPCHCPCGVEPCVPECACYCDGGAYLGCSSESMSPFDKFIGTWLVGWSGGMNHFSWVRLEPGSVARFLDGADLSVNAPFWQCNGVGQWAPTARIDTVALYFPEGCDPSFLALSFLKVVPAGGYPKGATEAASIETTLASGSFVEGYKFPHAQCDDTLTTCVDPFL